MENTDQRIKDILCDATGYEWKDIKPGDRLVDDLGLDSLDIAKMETDIEESLGLDVKPNALEGVVTAQDLVTKIEDMVGAKGVF